MRKRFFGCCIASLFSVGLLMAPMSLQADGPARLNASSGEELVLEPALPVNPLPAKTAGEAPAVTGQDDGAPRGPGSDNCAGATAVSDGVHFFSTVGATADGPTHTAAECQNAGGTFNNVWFAYTATCTGLATITTCEDLGGSATYDTKLALYTGTCASLTLVACNDDDVVNACGAAPNYRSTINAEVTSGTTYLIAVGGFSAADTGTGNLSISCQGGLVGACCLPDQTCQEVSGTAACDALNGLFAGLDTTCATTVCPCGDPIWADINAANATAIAGAAPGVPSTELGNEIQLGNPTGFRDICRVSAVVQEGFVGYEAVDGTPFNMTCTIWNSCPAAGTAAGACGNSGATIIGTATVNNITVPTGTAIFVDFDFSPPLANVPNNIAVMFRASRAGPGLQLGGAAPTIGTIPTGNASRCGSTTANNGCVRNFGVNNAFSFIVEAQASAGSGSCCNIQTGTCVDGVPAAQCTGANNVFTVGGTCATCTQAVGACCVSTGNGCLDGQTIDQCATAGGTFQGDGTTCATAGCPPICPSGSSGQALVPGVGQGAGGTIATVSDINPNYGTFTAAENITPTADGTITAIRWWGLTLGVGGGFPPCAPQLGDSPDDFTITLWNDALDLPFQILQGPLVQGTNFSLTETDTNLQFAGRNYAMYEATGLNIPVLADRCYWIEIVNHLTGQCTFLWAVAPAGDGKSVTGSNSAYAPGDENDFDLAICVDIQINADGCDSAIEIAGACCLNQGTSCTDNAGPSACISAGGVFVGFLTTCTPGLCNGACCDPGNPNVCTITTQDGCINAPPFGTFQGVGTVCTPSPCSGACCLADGTCQVTNQLNCEAQLGIGLGGSFTGGATCAQVTCSTFDICSANVLACNSSTTFNNAAQAEQERFDPLTDTAPALSCFGGVGGDNGVGSFWVTFTGTGGEVEVSTCNSAVNDTVIALYTRADGNCFAVTATDEVACSEDDASCLPTFNSKICAPTVLNQQYWVQITAFDENSVGSMTVDVTCPCPVAACATCPADVNNDNTRDGADIAGFVACLLGGGTNCICGDTDASTTTDLNDIPSFVNLLLNNTGACP